MTERIGRYDLVKTLAEGDRGKLYLARSTGFGGFARHVVVKTFDKLPGAAEGPFIEEALTLGRLHHQHITQILDVGRDGDRFFVALDFVHGRSARDVWHQTFTIGALLPLDFAVTVVAAAASALHYAHTRRRTDGTPLGLVHGHVSLSNVLIGFDGSVQLIGFAGASARGLRASETQLGFAKDQLAYLAPEQARRIGLDHRSDVFALGILLHELTTMRRTFRDDSDRLTIERVKIGTYVKPRAIIPDFSPDLERVIVRALQTDRDARYPNAEHFRRELVAVGHRLDLVLGDVAIVEVMAQLFEDSSVDPWTNAHADTSPDALAPDTDPGTRRRPLRAATETVDALAIELEIAIDGARGDTARTDTDRAAAAADDTRTTTPVPRLASAPSLPPPPPAPSRIDTDGVPVLHPLPAPPIEAPPPSPPRRRKLDFRLVAVVAGLATIAVTTAVVFALRSPTSSRTTPPPSDAPVLAVTVDASIPDAAVIELDAAAPDASATVRLQITSTPTGATVLVDGKRLGKTPFDGVVDRAEGTKHIIKVRKSSYVTGRLETELATDITQDFVLVRESSDAPSPE